MFAAYLKDPEFVIASPDFIGAKQSPVRYPQEIASAKDASQ